MGGIRYAAELPTTRTANIAEVLKWCEEHYGPPSIMNGRWVALDYTVQFKERKDRDWFILRWGM